MNKRYEALEAAVTRLIIGLASIPELQEKDMVLDGLDTLACQDAWMARELEALREEVANTSSSNANSLARRGLSKIISNLTNGE